MELLPPSPLPISINAIVDDGVVSDSDFRAAQPPIPPPSTHIWTDGLVVERAIDGWFKYEEASKRFNILDLLLPCRNSMVYVMI